MKAASESWFRQFAHHKFLRIFVRVYVIYLAIAIIVLMPLLNWAGSAIYQQQTGRPLQYDLIIFNPFTLSLTLNQAVDKNPDGSVLWSAERLHVNFSLVQTGLHFAPTLDRFETRGLWAHPHKLSTGEWTFADILAHQAARPKELPVNEPSEELAIPALVINEIAIDIRAIAFTDATQEEVFHTSFEDAQLELRDFSTIKEDGQPYYLHAKAGDGGEFNWRGEISVKARQSQGELTLKNVALKPIWQYLKSTLNFNLRSADFNFAGSYSVSWEDELQWSITDSQMALINFDIYNRKKNIAETTLSFSRLNLTGIEISSSTQWIDVAEVELTGLHITSWSDAEKSGMVELFRINPGFAGTDSTIAIGLSTAASTTSSSASSSESSTTAGPEKNSMWVARIKSVEVKPADINWRVAELGDHEFHISNLQIHAKDVHSGGDTAADIAITAEIDQQTKLALAGAVNLVNIDGDLLLDLHGLPLNLINPLLQSYLKAEILTGQLDLDAKIVLRDGAATQVSSKGDVTGFALRPLHAPDELVRWNNFNWSEAFVDLQQQSIFIPLIELVGFDSQFIITQDGKTNLQTIFSDVAEPVEQTDSEQKTSTESHVQEEVAEPWQFELKKFVLSNASFRFNDQSLTPDFTAAVQHFNGELTDLSSTDGKMAAFSFKGDVDGYAPVTLNGKTQPFLQQPKLDAILNFENIDLGGFSTYSSTYAGWQIERGLLTANLHYRLADGRIIGDNLVMMDQLQLGDKVNSASAADIPLRLALALLTDENGIATLDFNVTGNPDDPNFNIRKIVWAAVRNTLVKAVTAPFGLLANLVGSKEDLGQIKFNSGSTQLLSNATRKLTLLEAALNKRPNLRVEARGHYDLVTDTRGLKAARIKKILLDQGLSSDDIKKKNTAWGKVIAEQYQKLDLPVARKITTNEQYEQLLQSIAITEVDLKNLAIERSVVTKQFLVQHLKVDGSRVLINSELDCQKNDVCTTRIVRFDLSDLTQ